MRTMTSTTEVVSIIQTLYESGWPFFTKERIRETYLELKKNNKKGDKVPVRGLDGKFYEFEIRTGTTFPVLNTDLEFFMEEPFICYLSIQDLIRPENINPQLSYCNIRIFQRLALRNKLTKEIVNTSHTQSPEEAKESLQTGIHIWQASERCKKLVSTLILMQTSCISKIVAFACGPIQVSLQDRSTSCSAFQHALILTLHDIISNKSNRNNIQCYAQDLAYSEIDKTILKQSGIMVLDDPEGFLEVDDSTIVISCSSNVPVKQIVSDLAQSAIMIWDRIEKDGIEQETVTDPDTSRLRKWILNYYDAIEFPGGKEHFGDLVMYVRRPAPIISRSS